jgi:uncharacterized protein DUF5054
MSPETAVSKVHLVCKTHLDVGFTDFGDAVLHRYLSDYIPRAIRLARDTPEGRFVWTTGSWLIWEFLERGSAQDRSLMEQAIESGWVAWHALPFTTHSELLDLPLLADGLRMSAQLDERFGRHTIAAKMTDVPGHTRGIVGPLVDAGVEFLHLGVNPASSLPRVPPVFRWRDPNGRELTVMYQQQYGDFTVFPGSPVALAVSHTGDNQGPQDAEGVLAECARLGETAPGAEILGSTLDAFAAEIRPWTADLPVVTAEIGDSWIHGVASDPQLLARYRALRRLNAEWQRHDPDFTHNLLLVVEHTWGLDHKTTLPDLTAGYDRAGFAELREQPAYQRMEASWQEKRELIDRAVESLDADRAALAKAALDELTPVRVQRGATTDSLVLEANGVRMRLDPGAGDVIELSGGEFDWASESNRLASLTYEIFSADDYRGFYGSYNRDHETNADWSIPDFTKPGLPERDHAAWQPVVEHIEATGPLSRRVWLRFPSEAVEEFGCPALSTVEYRLESTDLHIDVQWFDKAATRWPEAMWLSFVPRLPDDDGSWWISKLGQRVRTDDVVERGGRHLHAADDEFGYAERLRVRTVDAALVCPGRRRLLQFTDEQPENADGMHVNLYNNTWGTNFPGWSGDDARFRFSVRL